MDVLLVCSLVLISAALSCQGSWEGEWGEWRLKYSKQYASLQEEDAARHAWMRNMAYIQAHNNRSDVTYILEMNEFGDQDWSSRKVLLKPVPKLHTTERLTSKTNPPPENFDWRKHGVISPVINQGMMTRPDAVCVAECLESLHAIRSATKELVELSVQEVVDCCSQMPGLLDKNPYECIHKLGGLCSATSYPNATASRTPACRSKQCKAVADDATRTVRITNGDEKGMVEAVLNAPLVVYIDASRPSFQFYRAGVYADPRCSHELDHAVQVVGYGVKDGVKYWILKNSWGTDWGMSGFMLMQRDVNMCGVADNAFQPQ